MQLQLRDGHASCFRRGKLVAVRSPQEIARTLDPDGHLDGLPFMPEMLQFCGQVFRVHRRAEKICVEAPGMRRLERAVLLEDVRCDGSAHGGCDRRCLIFWREDWLREANSQQLAHRDEVKAELPEGIHLLVSRKGRHVCQSTELYGITTLVPFWDLRQYYRDLVLGQATVFELVEQLWLLAYNKMRRILIGKRGRVERAETQNAQTDTPKLQPGDLVEVRSREEIQATLDESNCHLGLEFMRDMWPHCGKRFRVLHRVKNIILTRSGQTRRIRNTVVLDGAVCDGKLARGCTRANFAFWREVWLKKVADPSKDETARNFGGAVSGQ